MEEFDPKDREGAVAPPIENAVVEELAEGPDDEADGPEDGEGDAEAAPADGNGAPGEGPRRAPAGAKAGKVMPVSARANSVTSA